MVTDAMIAAARDEFLKFEREDDIPHDEVIRRALEAAEKAAWRPISEAPKDGTVFLVPERAVGSRVNVQPCAWMQDRLTGSLFGEAWRNPLSSQFALSPTHFRPLPTPPEASHD